MILIITFCSSSDVPVAQFKPERKQEKDPVLLEYNTSNGLGNVHSLAAGVVHTPASVFGGAAMGGVAGLVMGGKFTTSFLVT